MKFEEKVWKECKKIPKGKVSTYQEIGKGIRSNAYRAIGNALKKNPYAPSVPCHRVVCSDGKLGGYMGKRNSSKKKELLKKEGVIVIDGRIVEFEKKLFRFGK